MVSVIVDIIRSAIIIVVASWITVRLALRRFYTEKWWDEELEHKKTSPEARKRVSEEYASAKRVIENAVAVGSFIVSEEATEVLGSFLKELQKEDIQGNWLKDLDRHHGEVIKCIARLREIAKRELSKR